MTNESLAIPHTPSSISPKWLTLALKQAGILTRAQVVAIDVRPIAAGSGFVGQTAGLTIQYDEQEAGAPATVFAKLSSADPAVRQQLRSVGIYETEVGFYRDVASLPKFPIRVPRAYLALYDVTTGASLLLLEDLSPVEFGDNLVGCSTDDAAVVMRQLGLLHAHFWDAPLLKQLPWLRSLTDEAEARIALYRAMLPRLEQRCAGFLTPRLVQCARTFAQTMPLYVEEISTRPQTLTHGDFRADNFAFAGREAGRDTTVFDWQVARRAAGPRDLAYFLSGSLPIEQRRATEQSLLATYHKTLVANGVTGYHTEDLRQDVLAGLGAPLTTWVIAGGMLDFSSERGADLFRQIYARLGAMLEDYRFDTYMSELTTTRTSTSSPSPLVRHEVYSAGYDPLVVQGLMKRSAAREAAFFIPHLTPTMQILDCGCGPGGITITLASLVPQGRVVGIDLEENQLAIGRREAQQRGVSNIEFRHASVYTLPFADGTFDAILAHAVLYHLAEPMKAIQELQRVLKPGGLIGLRDADLDGDVYYPGHEAIDRFWTLAQRIITHNGGDVRFGRKQRRLLREAGFRNIVASASSDAFGTSELTVGFSRYWANAFLEQHRRFLLTEHWATEAELTSMQQALLAWGTNPDAFHSRCRCEAIGWK